MPDWPTLDRALDRALALDEPHRGAFVAALDPATRAALGPLLASALADDPLLDHGAGALAPLVGTLAEAADGGTASVAEGARVGPYRVEALVGKGGMGRVYRVYRADGTLEQTVALKVVRQTLALAGSDVAARLRRKRDLLAALDHVGIARLLDGGETSDGVPYLAMEFVDGTPITEWADAHALGVAERVRMLDAEGERDSGAFPITRTGLRLLTPAYAAPELFDRTATVTTAADVYGLGALLYEVLSGRHPHADAGAAGPTREAARPSLAATTGDGTLTSPAAAARSRALRGDLDTVVLKAPHPDPARRYASAAALADDLERHLDGRPVAARPDSVAYVASRFVQRHRGVVAAGVVAVVALVAGLAVALVALGREREARAASEAHSAQAEEVAALLGDLFEAADPEQADGRAVTAREALDRGRARVSDVEDAALRG